METLLEELVPVEGLPEGEHVGEGEGEEEAGDGRGQHHHRRDRHAGKGTAPTLLKVQWKVLCHISNFSVAQSLEWSKVIHIRKPDLAFWSLRPPEEEAGLVKLGGEGGKVGAVGEEGVEGGGHHLQEGEGGRHHQGRLHRHVGGEEHPTTKAHPART